MLIHPSYSRSREMNRKIKLGYHHSKIVLWLFWRKKCPLLMIPLMMHEYHWNVVIIFYQMMDMWRKSHGHEKTLGVILMILYWYTVSHVRVVRKRIFWICFYTIAS